MSQRHSDSSLDEKLLEYRFHAELRLDANGNPVPGLPMVRGSLKARANAAFEPDAPESLQPPPPGDEEPRPIILSTQSPAALKMGTQQLIPKSLAVASKAKTKSPARHQSFGAAVLSKEAARRTPQLLPAPSFSLDDMDMDAVTGGNLKRNLRNQSYRAAMKGLGPPSSKEDSVRLGPKLQALAEEAAQPPARHPAKNKKTWKRANKGSFKDDPQLYQEIRERGLNTSHESDDDILDEPSSSGGTQRGDTTIVVKTYRPAQLTWSQLPEVLESGILDTLSVEERKRQEAIFEILTSEFSYLHSLKILVNEFLQSQELKTTMTQTEHHHLFSNISDVLAASQK